MSWETTIDDDDVLYQVWHRGLFLCEKDNACSKSFLHILCSVFDVHLNDVCPVFLFFAIASFIDTVTIALSNEFFLRVMLHNP